MSEKIIITYPNGCENTKEDFSNGWNQSVVTAPYGKEITVSDGYHTMDELYDHRIELFIQLCYQKWYHEVVCNEGRNNIWRSKKHSDGELAFGGSWFVLGINKEEGKQITYHLPISRWEDTDFAETLETAPPYDGHTPNDVLERLKTI